MHFSTDYVFDGCATRPYREEDAPRPLSVYGASKLAGELLVAASGVDSLIVRTSGVLGRGGSEQKGGSFVDRILSQARAGTAAARRLGPGLRADDRRRPRGRPRSRS